MVSDIICPWCYVGKLRLQKAIELIGAEDQVELSYRPHILYPHIPDAGKDITKKSSLKEVKDELMKSAQEMGVTFNLRGIKRIPQTKILHSILMTLSSMAAWKMKEHMFEAYFVNGLDLSDQTVIKDLLAHHGYDYQMAPMEEVDTLIAENRTMGVSAVPTFILPGDVSITGAQPVDRWVSYLTKTLSKA